MSTDIPFILDALQTASAVQVQVDFLHVMVIVAFNHSVSYCIYAESFGAIKFPKLGQSLNLRMRFLIHILMDSFVLFLNLSEFFVGHRV